MGAQDYHNATVLVSPASLSGPWGARHAGFRPGKARKVILWGLACAVAVVLLAVAFAPSLISAFGRGYAERAAGAGIEGSVRIERMALSWGGPQEIGPVKLLDPAGDVVGEADISAGVGLFSLATGGLDLGEVKLKVRGDIKQIVSPTGKEKTTNLEAALRPSAKAGAGVPRPGPTQPGAGGTGAPAAVRLPAGLAARLRIADSEVKYTGELTPGSGVRTIGLTGLTASADFALGQPLSLTVAANTLDGQKAISIEAKADALTQADGLVTLDKASADAKIDGAIPAEYLELIAARSGGAGVSSVADPASRVVGHFKLAGGRLTLADPARPAFVELRVPAAAFAVPGKDGAAAPLSVSERPTVTFIVETLDMPVAGSGAKAADYRGGKVTAFIRSTKMAGSLSMAGGDGSNAGGSASVHAFGVEPFELKLATPDLAEGIGLIGRINTSLDGRGAGMVSVDVVAAEMLDGAGAFRAGGPGKLRGQFLIDNVPTALLQPFAQASGVDLSEVFGPKLEADLRTGLMTVGAPAAAGGKTVGSALAGGAGSSSGGASADGGDGTPYVSGTVSSAKTKLWFDVWLDPDRVRARNEGIKLQSTALGYLVRRFKPEGTGVTCTGEGIASITLTDFEVPGLLGGKGPDLSGTRANVRVIAGELVAQMDGRGAPVKIVSLDVQTKVDGEKNPKLVMRHVLEYEGQRMEIGGDVTVTGLFKKDPGAAGGVALSLGQARPEGSIRVTDVPASIASLAGEQARRIADAAIGSKLNIEITAAPSSAVNEAGASLVQFEINSARTTGQGQLLVGDGRIKTMGDGLMLTLRDPAGVLNAALNPAEGSNAAEVVFDGTGELHLGVSGIDMALGESSIKMGGLAARAKAATAGLGVTLKGPNGGGERVLVSSFASEAVLDGKGGADLTIDSTGTVQGTTFAAKGTIGAGHVLGDAGMDLRTVEPRGSLTLTQVPSSLVAMLSPENGVLAQAVLGGTIDAQVSALKGEKGVEFNVTTPQVLAKSRAVIAGDKLTVGPTDAEASLTPAAVDAILALKAPQLSPRPALAGTSRILAKVTPMTLPITGPTQVAFNPLGGYRASVNTEGDIVVRNAAVLGAGTASARPLNVGIRMVGAAAAMKTDPSRPEGEFTASLELFDPANPGPTIAKVRVDGGPNLPAQLREAKMEVPSTAAVDKWLGTPELLTLAVGDTISLMSMGQPVTQAGAGVLLTTIVESPKLQTRISVGMNENGVKVQPFDAVWTLDPRLANRYLFVDAAGKPTASLSRAVTTNLKVRALEIGPSGRPLDPKVFRADIGFSAPGLAISTPDGVEADMGDLQGRINSAAGGAIAFDISTPGVRLTSAGGGAPPASGTVKVLTIKGTLEDIADATGVVTPERAAVTAKIDGGLPTPLIDALAGQGGALVDLLGSRVDTAISTSRLSKQAGSLSANLMAENANAFAEGEVRGGAFAASKQVVVRMHRITPEASKRFISSALPILDKVEKTADDKPAVITADGFTAPLDGDMRKLNGDLVFDLGTVQFQSSDFFGKILKATSNRSMGKIGQKIAPFTAQVREGVVNYNRFAIPTGEFEMSTEGKVDLVRKKMKLTVWVPAFALADEIAGMLKLRSLPGLKEVSSIPLSVTGDLSKPDIGIDFGRMGQDILNAPGKSAEGAAGGVEDIVKGVGDLFKKKKK